VLERAWQKARALIERDELQKIARGVYQQLNP